ncbi:MAG: glycosyltransferase family 39 protein [Nitrospirae bacterium]|nr:glycosyltransferase family 39 protein [Nitrospirota bacterium]
MKEGDRVHIYSLLAIILIAAAIRIYLVFFKIMEYDEGVSTSMFILNPLSYGLTNYPIANNHIFHTLLAHISYRIFGIQPWAIRLPALIAGILLVPASYLFVRSFYNKYAALLTAAFVATSDPLIYFSIAARGYSLLVLFFLLIIVIAAYLKQNDNLFLWLLFAIISALGFYTIPIMLYPYGIVIIWLLLSGILKDTKLNQRTLLINLFISVIITFVLTSILYSPVIIVSGLKSLIFTYNAVPKDWSIFISKLPPIIVSTWKEWNEGIPFLISFLLVSGFFISLFFHSRLSVHRIPIIASVLWLIPVLLIQRVIPFTRVWLFLLPLYLGLASSGIYYFLARFIEPKYRNIRSVVLSILSIILVLSLGLSEVQARKEAYYERKGTLKDPDYTAIFLKNNIVPGDRVLFIGDWLDFNFDYYFALHKLPAMPDPKSARRLFVYVNHKAKDTVEVVLNSEGLSVVNYSTPKILLHDKYATIYELIKLTSNALGQ